MRLSAANTCLSTPQDLNAELELVSYGTRQVHYPGMPKNEQSIAPEEVFATAELVSAHKAKPSSRPTGHSFCPCALLSALAVQ